MALEALLQPLVLFFLLGALADFARFDLAIPKAVAKGIWLFRMMSIGLCGGASGIAVAHGRWREDQLSGATAKVMMLAITSTSQAASFVDLLAPLLESHHIMLLLPDVEVVRRGKFA